MEKELNLVEILKDCPKGTKLYSTLHGEVSLYRINLNNKIYPIEVIPKLSSIERISKNGISNIDYSDAECILFPSKENRDWSKFKAKKPRFDPKTLKHFDKILARNTKDGEWNALLFSHINTRGKFIAAGSVWLQVIPYNDETKHLVGTTEEAPKYYRYWEDYI